MTSEVVVMNKLGLALAADSAVTVTATGAGKVFNSADKLFMLSKKHPVGVMVYENANILGIPWETIIKMFRAHLGAQSFDTLEEYGNALIAYLEHNEELFPEELQHRYYLKAVEDLFGELASRADEREGDMAVIVKEEILYELDVWKAYSDASCLPEGVGVRLAGRFSAEINKKMSDVFEGYGIDAECSVALYELARMIVAKDRIPRWSLSGIVVAGFGNKNVFPVMQHVEIGDVYEGKLKCRYHPGKSIGEKTPSHVQPFADCDVVQGFLHGISPKFHVEVVEQLAELLFGLPPMIIDEIDGLDEAKKQDAKDKFLPMSRKAIETLFEGLDKYRNQEHFSPIEQAVATMPKEELGHAASRLISLNWFQKRMSLNSETVGGPVDVAVITKGDGFVWVERKHYFPAELNPHFFTKFTQPTEETGTRDGKSSNQEEEEEQAGRRPHR